MASKLANNLLGEEDLDEAGDMKMTEFFICWSDDEGKNRARAIAREACDQSILSGCFKGGVFRNEVPTMEPSLYWLDVPSGLPPERYSGAILWLNEDRQNEDSRLLVACEKKLLPCEAKHLFEVAPSSATDLGGGEPGPEITTEAIPPSGIYDEIKFRLTVDGVKTPFNPLDKVNAEQLRWALQELLGSDVIALFRNSDDNSLMVTCSPPVKLSSEIYPIDN